MFRVDITINKTQSSVKNQFLFAHLSLFEMPHPVEFQCAVHEWGWQREKKTKALIWKLNYIPGKACHQNNNEIYIVECLIEHEKSSLFRSQRKNGFCQPSKDKAITRAHRRAVCMSQRLNPAKRRLDSGGPPALSQSLWQLGLHCHSPRHLQVFPYAVCVCNSRSSVLVVL